MADELAMLICVSMVIALWPATVAGLKGHSFLQWWLLSAMFLPFGILGALIVPHADCMKPIAVNPVKDRTSYDCANESPAPPKPQNRTMHSPRTTPQR